MENVKNTVYDSLVTWDKDPCIVVYEPQKWYLGNFSACRCLIVDHVILGKAWKCITDSPFIYINILSPVFHLLILSAEMTFPFDVPMGRLSA